ncbi:MAG: ImmA/IrrE family metallo-endopeptidase [Chloroflexi bacterium]|nr:ImmA/IrrE family metallo-endopeptidase [Chloroflexota bacterium]
MAGGIIAGGEFVGDSIMTIDTHVELPKDWANPAMLEWARASMGLNREDVEALAGIAAERIRAWEHAQEAPALSDLQGLAEIYDCPVGFLFLDSPPKERMLLDFRGLTADKIDSMSYETRVHLSEFLRLTDYLASLMEDLSLTHRVDIDAVGVDDPVETVAAREREKFGFTSEIRQRWATANEAFEFWRQAIESRGVFVFSLKLKASEVRGTSRWEAPHVPAILVNRADVELATGRTFTLLHEWAHLLIKRAGWACDFRGQAKGAVAERFANQFAAETLVPKIEFEAYLKNRNLNEKRARWGDVLLDGIRREFKVSRDVIAISLEERGFAPRGFYQRSVLLGICESRFSEVSLARDGAERSLQSDCQK